MCWAQASSSAVSRSRSDPFSGGIGAGGIRLWNAAAKRSLPLGKWRYRVARATLAPRSTASTVTALGPPDRSSAVAASSRRARERAGLGSVRPPAMLRIPVLQQRCPPRYKTVSLESHCHRRRRSVMVEAPAPLDQTTDPPPTEKSKRARLWTLVVACLGVLLVISSMVALNTALADIALQTSASQTQL